VDRISKHISFQEGCYSSTALRKGIVNSPSEEVIDRMIAVASCLFEPLRAGLGNKPIMISSFFRCPELNAAIGGAKYSQHMYGTAIDLVAIESTGLTNLIIFEYIRTHLCFDKLILEHPDKYGNPSWVHVSFTSAKRNRGEIYEAYSEGGRTVYELLDKYIT